MKETMHGQRQGTEVSRAIYRRRNYKKEVCSICHGRLHANAVPITEPEGVPDPRRSWILCRDCYEALVVEMRRSPVRTPTRLRVAMGIVAAERWPGAYSNAPRRSIFHDRRKIMFIVWAFIIAMIVHLALIVAIATMAR
jgi:hypothetical protein